MEIHQRVCAFDETERLTELLSLLDSELRRSQLAASRFDIDEVERHSRRIDAICREVRSAIRRVSEKRRISPENRCVAIRPQLRGLIERVAEAATIYGQLVGKSRRTIDVLMNVWATSAVAYTPPRISFPLELEV